MLKYGLALTCAALLTACGATDNNSDNNGNNGGTGGMVTAPGNGNAPGNNQGAPTPTIDGIAGLWVAEIDYEEDGVDQFYLSFSNSGTVGLYDYMGDSYDLEGNCYSSDANFGRVSDQGNGNFRILFEGQDGTYALDLRLNNNQLQLVEDDHAYPFLYRTSLQTSDMQPDCAF